MGLWRKILISDISFSLNHIFRFAVSISLVNFIDSNFLSTDGDLEGIGVGWQGPNQRIALAEDYIIVRCRDCGVVRKVDMTGTLIFISRQ
ncbi:MAG: hypothetical protein IJV15_08595 [Lachnospiraceae bacterium]|nr:hypothetical protein [Lachnospiraceae bacterium]